MRSSHVRWGSSTSGAKGASCRINRWAAYSTFQTAPALAFRVRVHGSLVFKICVRIRTKRVIAVQSLGPSFDVLIIISQTPHKEAEYPPNHKELAFPHARTPENVCFIPVRIVVSVYEQGQGVVTFYCCCCIAFDPYEPAFRGGNRLLPHLSLW